MFRLHVEPTTLANLHSHYYNNHKESICSTRWDMFALLLLNAGPFHKVLVSEQGKGLLLAAILERGAQSITVASSKRMGIKKYAIVEQLNLKEIDCNVNFEEWEKLS